MIRLGLKNSNKLNTLRTSTQLYNVFNENITSVLSFHFLVNNINRINTLMEKYLYLR